jgi:hypothetical protein
VKNLSSHQKNFGGQSAMTNHETNQCYKRDDVEFPDPFPTFNLLALDVPNPGQSGMLN